MLPTIAKLLQVQERDQRLRALQRDLKEIPNLQARAKSQLSDDQAAMDAAHAGMRDVEVKMKTLDLDVQTRQNTIKRLKDQQFETRKNDEFTALGNEVKRYEKDVHDLEDKQIELMEALEAVKVTLKAAQEKLAITQGHVNQELKQLDERQVNIQQRLVEVQAERAEIAAPVDPESLNLYDRLSKNKGGTAIVVAENGVCGGCHMKLVISTLASLKGGKEITHCEQCGRILYFA
ncbi:MAG: putative zinc ribbon domain protein [Verrucomicrobiaceae bacterium]|nr:putative zinc ribbon domain protein [Verrucomicrobiaceae bacterium]